MDELLAESDIVSLHVPDGEKTRHLIGREQFEKMKDGAVLINTVRGDMVDQSTSSVTVRLRSSHKPNEREDDKR